MARTYLIQRLIRNYWIAKPNCHNYRASACTSLKFKRLLPMPFIPHTEQEVKAMLDVIGVNQIEDLFDEIPDELRCGPLSLVPEGINEMELNQLMVQLSEKDGQYVNFIGAGVYEHHIPAAVWELTTRGEYYTAYTPYQAEASQGTLQLLYEYQSMMASLTGMDVSNASMYEGASALAIQ